MFNLDCDDNGKDLPRINHTTLSLGAKLQGPHAQCKVLAVSLTCYQTSASSSVHTAQEHRTVWRDAWELLLALAFVRELLSLSLLIPSYSPLDSSGNTYLF